MPFDPDAASLPSSGADEHYHHHQHHQQRHFPFPFGYPPSTTSGFLRQLDDSSTNLNHTSKKNHTTTTTTTSNSSSTNNMHTVSGRGGGYSPPAWRRLGNGDRSSGFWRKGGDNLLGYGGLPPELDYDSVDECDDDYDVDVDDNDEQLQHHHRYHRNQQEVDDILAAAIRTRLPTGSMSPEKERSPEPEWRYQNHHRAAQQQQQQQANGHANGHPKNALGGGAGDGDVRVKSEEPDDADDLKATLAALPPHKEESENYIRFALRASVQQRSEPLEAVLTTLHNLYQTTTSSYASLLLSALAALLAIAAARALFASDAHARRPVPDLVKVAGIARSFEPLIYYSENGVAQVGDLQATGVAVWDLGESVRSSNLTSAPIIVRELDELSESLKTLAVELTRFFANVDGDVDGILIVIDWARRELSHLPPTPSTPLTSAFDNIHTLLSHLGILEHPTTGTPTSLGTLATTVFGLSNPQRTRQTLQRTFNEFLAVLEQAINDELTSSLSLFGLFEAIDHQFLNLARTVVREANAQDEQHADLLSSLWTRLLGPKASAVAKYERNRLLLRNVREKTVRNKGILVEHNHKLLALKANLEALRRKLVSPLVRSVNSSTLSVDEQIRGLEDVGGYLEGVRARQKGKLMEMLYGGGSVRGIEGDEAAGRRRLF